MICTNTQKKDKTSYTYFTLNYYSAADLILSESLIRITRATTDCDKSIRCASIEPPHDKTNKTACAPSEDSDQPGHPPSLIRVFAVRMVKAWTLSYPLCAKRRLWSDWADAQADLNLCWAHSHFVDFVMRQLKWNHLCYLAPTQLSRKADSARVVLAAIQMSRARGSGRVVFLVRC